jgi:hypothetical protein
MAEESILLRVGVDPAQIAASEKAIISARTEIERLTEANKELADQGKKNSIEYVKNQTDIKDLSTVVRENERVLAANAKMSRSAGGSIAELRESVKALQADYINLSKEERENEKIGGELQKRIKAQTDELKSLEKEIGITSRNVGNYTESIIGAVDQTGLFTKVQGLLSAGQNAVNVAIQGGTIASKSFGAALKAAGIGLILVVLTAFISLLTRTQEGLDFVAKATAALGTFVGVLLDRLTELARDITASVVPVLTGLKDILVGIATLDFDQLKAGLEGVRDGVANIKPINIIELGAAAARAAAQAFELEGALQKVQRAEKLLEVDREKSIAQIEALKEAAQDESRAFSARAKDLETANAIERKQLEDRRKLAQERLDIIKQQNALTESKDSDLQKERDIEIEIARIEAESARKRTELAGQLKGIRAQERAESERIAAENKARADKEDADRIASEKKIADEAIAEQRRVNAEFKALADQRSKETELAIRETINDLKTDFAEGLIDLETFQEELDQVEALALATRRAALETQLQATRENAEIDAATRLELETNLQAQLRAIEDQEVAAAVQKQQDKLNAEKAAADERVRLAEETASAQIKAEDAVLQAALNVFGQQSAAGKIAASFQALLDAFRGANLALGTIPPPFGQIVAASTLASGLANVAKINSTKKPKFEDGGAIEVSGPSHAGGGVPLSLGNQTVAEVEGDEGIFVMKRNAFQSLKALSNHNQKFGGRSWFGGGAKYLADGGAVARGGAPGIDRSAIRDASAGIQEAFKDIQIVARISDINRVNSEVKKVEVQGDLR